MSSGRVKDEVIVSFEMNEILKTVLHSPIFEADIRLLSHLTWPFLRAVMTRKQNLVSSNIAVVPKGQFRSCTGY